MSEIKTNRLENINKINLRCYTFDISHPILPFKNKNYTSWIPFVKVHRFESHATTVIT